MSRHFRILAVTLLVATACQTGRMGSTSPTPSPLPAVDCTVPMPSQWQAIMRQGTPNFAPDQRVIPFAASADPFRFFADLYSPAWSGVVSVTVPSGNIDRVASFEDPANDQVSAGSFDGRWLVWGELLSLDDINRWRILAWDSSTKRSFVVAIAPTVNGSTVSGPIIQPVVSDGRAAWVQANQWGIGEVHLYDLATRRERIVDTGAGLPVRFWGSNLIWQHLDIPAREGHLEMINAASGKLVTVPEPLASVRQLSSLAVSSRLVAWTDGRSVRAYRGGETVTSIIFATPVDHADFLGIAADLITWDGPLGPSALDVRSYSATRLTPSYGGRVAAGNSLLVYWPLANTKGLGPLAISDIDASKLAPLPRCAK